MREFLNTVGTNTISSIRLWNIYIYTASQFIHYKFSNLLDEKKKLCIAPEESKSILRVKEKQSRTTSSENKNS